MSPSSGDYSQLIPGPQITIEQLLETLRYTANKLSRCSDGKTDKFSNECVDERDNENTGRSNSNSIVGAAKKRTLSFKVFYRTDSGLNVEDLVTACQRYMIYYIQIIYYIHILYICM